MEHPQIRGLSEWRPLAQGGLAVVWQARQMSLDRPVAVKVYKRGLDEGDRARFHREAATAGSLSHHPGIVTVHNAGILPDDRPYLIMELCPGGSLSQWLQPENRPSEERVRQVGARIAHALAAVHAVGVLHRDVKPGNILIDSYGNPGLADFGLAAVAGTEAVPAGALAVTPAYAPPEAFRLQPATEAGDVFSLAATLYAVLSGGPPRRLGAGPVALEQLAELADRPIDPLAGVDRQLMGVVLAALSNDPAARPTAARFENELASRPTPAVSRPAPLARSAGDLASVPAAESADLGQATGPTGEGIAAREVPAESPGQVPATGRPRWRAGRTGVLALAASGVAAIGVGTARLVKQPASSAAPAAESPPVGGGEQRGTELPSGSAVADGPSGSAVADGPSGSAVADRIPLQPTGGGPEGKPALLWLSATPLRRAVGVAAVLILLAGAAFFWIAPGFTTAGPSTTTTTNPSVGTGPTAVGSPTTTVGGPPSSAGPGESSGSRAPTSTTSPGAGDNGGSGTGETFQLAASTLVARPFQTVRIEGRYRGGADTFLRVQWWNEGQWVVFPLPTKTDQSGRFTAYVDLGQTGRHRLRVLDPRSGVASKPFTVVIRG